MAVVGLHLVLNYMDMLSEKIYVPLAIGLSWFYPGASWCIWVYHHKTGHLGGISLAIS